jgi:hypothetical protein
LKTLQFSKVLTFEKSVVKLKNKKNYKEENIMYEKSNKWRSKKQDKFESGIKITPEMETQNVITAETNKLEIVTTKEFDEDYKYYGYEEFVRKVLQKCANKKELGLTGKITLIDSEPSKRIYLETDKKEEFTVRYFIQEQNSKEWKASYTLYKNVKDENGGGHGEEVSSGYAISHYVSE